MLKPLPNCRYRNVWYEMASEQCRQAFFKDPKAYVPGDEPLAPPPPRFFLLGPSHSGKTVSGRRIARRHRLFHISFNERLKEISQTPTSPFYDACLALFDDKVELDAQTVVGIIEPYWKEEPYRSSGFVLEGFPRNEDDARLAIEVGLFPDAVVLFSMDTEIGVKRILPKLVSAPTPTSCICKSPTHQSRTTHAHTPPSALRQANGLYSHLTFCNRR